MHSATALVVPSIWYENFPRTVVEAFACGLPVIASRIGALASLIEDGKTGILFNANDPADLAKALVWSQQNPEALRNMGTAARNHYIRNLTGKANITQLEKLYTDACTLVASGQQ